MSNTIKRVLTLSIVLTMMFVLASVWLGAPESFYAIPIVIAMFLSIFLVTDKTFLPTMGAFILVGLVLGLVSEDRRNKYALNASETLLQSKVVECLGYDKKQKLLMYRDGNNTKTTTVNQTKVPVGICQLNEIQLHVPNTFYKETIKRVSN